MDKDNSDIKRCMVRLVHDFQASEPKGILSTKMYCGSQADNFIGDQEKKNILANGQFHFDREWDYPYGESTNRYGSRSGRVKKRPNRSAARIRLGLVDKSFLPYDSILNQADLVKKHKAQQNKISKAKDDNKKIPSYGDFEVVEISSATQGQDDDDDDEDDAVSDSEVLYRYKDKQANKTAFSRTSRARAFDPTTVYNALGEIARRVMKSKKYKLDENAPKDDLSKWFDCLLDILELSDGLLGFYVKQDLEFGAYEITKVKDRQASKEATAAARQLDPKAAEVVVYQEDKGKRLPYTDQLWNQRRRFMWDAYEVVMEGYRDGLIEQLSGLSSWADAMSEYHDYFVDEERSRFLKTKPKHPHLIDISDVKYPVSKKRPADQDNTDDESDGAKRPKN